MNEEGKAIETVGFIGLGEMGIMAHQGIDASDGDRPASLGNWTSRNQKR